VVNTGWKPRVPSAWNVMQSGDSQLGLGREEVIELEVFKWTEKCG
jgi:hypothetical protein